MFDDYDDKLLLQNGWLDKIIRLHLQPSLSELRQKSLYKEKLTKYQIAFAKILKLKKQF